MEVPIFQVLPSPDTYLDNPQELVLSSRLELFVEKLGSSAVCWNEESAFTRLICRIHFSRAPAESAYGGEYMISVEAVAQAVADVHALVRWLRRCGGRMRGADRHQSGRADRAFDGGVRPLCGLGAEAFWRAWGKPARIVYPCGHVEGF